MPPEKKKFDAGTARDIVKRALELVADFAGDDIDNFTFARFKPYHTAIFIDAVKAYVKAVKRSEKSYYDIKLKASDLKKSTVGAFIQFLVKNKKIAISDESLVLTEADLKGGE
jgi:hypothetical protein